MAAAVVHLTNSKRRRFRDITVSVNPAPSSNSHHSEPPNIPIPHSSPSKNTSIKGFNNFNSALTAGLLNPITTPENSRSSTTLLEIMANDPYPPNSNHPLPIPKDDRSILLHRVSANLTNLNHNSDFNNEFSGNVRLTLSTKDELSVTLHLHRQVLVSHSRFLAEKLLQKEHKSSPCLLEITDCEDLEAYIEALRLMYAPDPKKKLPKEDVPTVLGILKACAGIGFDGGILSCLEYLEAVPWGEEDEEKVALLMSELNLEVVEAGEVMKRVSGEPLTTEEECGNGEEEVLTKLMQVVIEGKDEKARRYLQGLIFKMLCQNEMKNEVRKGCLYASCHECLSSLHKEFVKVAKYDAKDACYIALHADNLSWILDILIHRHVADDFMKTWASQHELSGLHSMVPVIHRYGISRITAKLFVGIGKGHMLASNEVRCMLVKTWLVPFYDDFGWLKRVSKGFDHHIVEDCLSNTILTLPLSLQQEILLAWFKRFSNSCHDCPNIQRAFEGWWRRVFSRGNNIPQIVQKKCVTPGATMDNS